MKAIERRGGDGLYINTGDWLTRQTYLEWDGREFTRQHFRADGIASEDGQFDPHAVGHVAPDKSGDARGERHQQPQ